MQNYISTDTAFPNNYPSMIGRLDQAIGSKNKLNIILFRASLTQSTPLEGYPKGIGPPGTNEGGYTVYRNTRGGSIDDVQQISSSMVLDSRLGVVWHPFGLRNPFDQGFDLSKISMSSYRSSLHQFPRHLFQPGWFHARCRRKRCAERQRGWKQQPGQHQSRRLTRRDS